MHPWLFIKPERDFVMSYLFLKDTVRIKKTRYFCRITEITNDYSMDVKPIAAFFLSLCNGIVDNKLILRCISITWNLEQRQAFDMLKEFTDTMYMFLDTRDDAELVQTRYKMEDFAYVTSPLPDYYHLETPANATLVLTDKCNFKCTYCYNSSGEGGLKNLSTGQWLDAVDQLIQMDVTKFSLTGGEPLLHPGFFEILERINSSGAHAYIATNGSLINQSMVEKFVSVKQPVVQISLDSALPEIHHELTQSSNSFEKVINAIEMLVNSGIKVNVKALLMPHTYKDIANLIILCRSLGVNALTLDCYDICSAGRGNPDFLLNDIMADRVQNIVDETKSKFNDMSCNFIRPKRRWRESHDIVMCGALSDGLVIRPDGEFTLCDKTGGNPSWHFGYFPQTSVFEFWHSEEIKNKLFPNKESFEEPCRSCDELSNCRSGCHANKQFFTTKPYAPDPCCWKANYENNLFPKYGDAL